MDTLLKKLDDVQDLLRDLEDFLEAQRDNEIIEFLTDNWKECLFGGLVVGIAIYQGKSYYMKQQNMVKINAKREKFSEKTKTLAKRLVDNPLGEFMTLERETILALEINELLKKLKSDELDPVAVLEAYQARALEAQEATNCVVDWILEARNQALELRRVPIEYRGPFHGLPISLKENNFVKGYDATAGLAKQINSPAQEDSPIVQRMKQLGAVPFCLTNVPQTMNTYACSNPVFGLTTHPMDKNRTPGGSSGGEAALIAMGGSILGLGSDVGGSLRIPAHFCGITALKPTTGRIFERGRRKGVKGQIVGVNSNAGFMSKKVDGVILGMKAFLKDPQQMSNADYKVVPLPWNKHLFAPKKRLKIGYYTDDGRFPLTPACKRAVEVAIETLDAQGCEIVYFKPPHVEIMLDFFISHMLADEGVNSLEMWKGEILDQAIEVNSLVYKTPKWLKWCLFLPLFSVFSKMMRDMALLSLRAPSKTTDLWKSLARLDAITHDVLTAWQQKGIDVIIAPGFAFPAPPVKHPARLIPAVSYTAGYNVLDFPVGSLPITRVVPQDEASMENYPANEDFLYKLVHQGACENTVGLPLNVQVVGRPWQEELVLHVMKLLQDNVNFH